MQNPGPTLGLKQSLQDLHASESPRRLVKAQITGPHLIQEVWGLGIRISNKLPGDDEAP